VSDPIPPRATAVPQGASSALADRAAPAAKLVVVAGPDEGLELALNDVVLVGTDETCTLRLTDPTVSRKHAYVAVTSGRIVVRDGGSTNGTKLGDTRVVEAQVQLGAVLTLGDTAIAIHPRWYTREVAPSAARAFGDLTGTSVAMREAFARLERVAPTEVAVLIEGETGTGKELAARSIHAASARRDGPYVVFDCTSIPHNLAESELFGHKEGAFSGAVSDRAGAFARAHGGTICLDEIGELPLDLQPKLLRVLETGELRAVGEDAHRKVDVRLISATNRDLHAEAAAGRFRSDLLYRLEVVRVRLPPLRHRPDDIPLLVAHFLQGRIPDGDCVEGENLQRLMSYSWPGNVRELRNSIERAIALSGTEGGQPPFASLVFNLGPSPASPVTIGGSYPGIASPMPYKQAKAQLLASFDRVYLETLLERHHGNVSKAAESAGLSRKHLYSLIQRANGDDSDAQ